MNIFITITVVKMITATGIITVLLKCAGDVQKVPTHKSNSPSFIFKNQQTTNTIIFVCIINKTITLPIGL